MQLHFYSILIALMTPALLLYFKRRLKFIEKIGVVIFCYLFGIIWGNLQNKNDSYHLVAHQLMEVSIALSIPLLLFSSKIMDFFKSAKIYILAFSISVFTVITSVFILFFQFQRFIPDLAQIAGMVTGVYIGGTPNLNAVGIALNVSEDLLLLANSTDMLSGGAFFFILMSIVIPLGLKFLSHQKKTIFEFNLLEDAEEEKIPMESIAIIKTGFIGFLLAILLLAVVIFLSHFFFNQLNFLFFICAISILAIICSLMPKIQNLSGSTKLGYYFIYVFSFSVGSLARLDQIFHQIGYTLFFFFLTMISSLFLQLLLGYFLKIPFQVSIISSVASIYGPAFIPAVAQHLKMRHLTMPGITLGLMGYAIATFLGLLVTKILIVLS